MFRFVHKLVLMFALFASITASGQDSLRHKGFGIETNIIAGKIIRHSVKFTAPVPPISAAVDLNFTWKTYGRKDWNQRCNFPTVGVGIMFTDYMSKNIFGRCVGVYPNIQVPFVKGERVEWTCRFGIGAAYVNKKYSLAPDYDTLNTAISSHVNAFPVLLSDVRYHVNHHWDVQAGVNFTHISNALFSEPNLGVNMVGGHIGVRYFPGTSSPEYLVRELPKLKNRWLLDVRAGIAHRRARAAGNPVKAAYLGAISVSRRWNSRNKVFAGIDAGYHDDVHAFLVNYGVEYGHEKQHSWDGGFFAGNEFVVGRVGMLGSVGVYYRQTFLDFAPVYEKLGVKYYLRNAEKGVVKEWFLSAMLNTHGIVAEYAEFGMGVAF